MAYCRLCALAYAQFNRISGTDIDTGGTGKAVRNNIFSVSDQKLNVILKAIQALTHPLYHRIFYG